MYANLHSAHFDTQRVGYLVVGHSVTASQYEQIARFVGHSLKRPFELLRVHLLLQLLSGPRVGRRHVHRVVHWLHCGPSLPEMVRPCVPSEPEHPRLEAATGVVGMAILQNPHEHLLHQVFRHGRIARRATQEVEHLSVMSFEQLTQGVEVASLHGAHQQFVGHGLSMTTRVGEKGYKNAGVKLGETFMAPTIPDPKKIKSFRTDTAFEAWMRTHHARETELWLKIHKKDSGRPTVTYIQALDVALCWGWIDGIRKSFDAHSFLQRYTPRRPRSVWSQVNREHVARLIAAGRMTPHGQRQIDAAKADGRWDAAYAPIRSASVATIPDDLRAAIDANTRARATFETLGRQNLFALTFRTNNMKTAVGRAGKIAALVDMLARGETIVPERPRRVAANQRVRTRE